MLNNRKQLEQLTKRARDIMHKTGIEALAKREVTEVSGGQLQRVGICRALMSEPKVIFGDEPTGALNSKSANEIMDLFSEIYAEGTTIVLVTHDIKVAARTERVLFMSDGRIVDELRLPKASKGNLEEQIDLVTAKKRELEI